MRLSLLETHRVQNGIHNVHASTNLQRGWIVHSLTTKLMFGTQCNKLMFYERSLPLTNSIQYLMVCARAAFTFKTSLSFFGSAHPTGTNPRGIIFTVVASFCHLAVPFHESCLFHECVDLCIRDTNHD